MRSALSQYTTISNMKTTKSKSRIYLKNVLIYGTELLQSTREPKVLECPFVLQRPSSPIFEGSSEIEFNESSEMTLEGLSVGWKHALFHLGSASDKKSFIFGLGLNTSGQLGLQQSKTTRSLEGVKYSSYLEGLDAGVVLSIAQSDPVEILLGTGREHSIVAIYDRTLKTQRIYSFGNNYLGALGQPEKKVYLNPTPVTIMSDSFPLDVPIKAIVCGLDHSFIVDGLGHLWASGWNSDGQLGISKSGTGDKISFHSEITGDCSFGFKRVHFESPSEVFIQKLASQADATLALDTNGIVYGWGNSEYAQCMNGGKVDFIGTPRKIAFPINEKIIDVAMGSSFSALLTESGKVYTCGYGNIHGKEGLLEVCSHLQPFSCEIKFKNIFALNHFFLATCSNNDIYMWGQLSSSSTGSILPRKLSLPGDLVEKRIFPGWSSVFIGTCH